MAGIETIITTKSGAQLLYLTMGVSTFMKLPTCSITGEKIVGGFLNSAFRPKVRATPALVEEILAITGPVSTEKKVRAAFEKLKAQMGTAEAKPAPKRKARATAAPKTSARKPAPAPSMDQIDRAKFDAAMAIIDELRAKMEVTAA